MLLDCFCSHVGRQLAADANGKKQAALDRAQALRQTTEGLATLSLTLSLSNSTNYPVIFVVN